MYMCARFVFGSVMVEAKFNKKKVDTSGIGHIDKTLLKKGIARDLRYSNR
jgi:hypothetical protein